MDLLQIPEYVSCSRNRTFPTPGRHLAQLRSRWRENRLSLRNQGLIRSRSSSWFQGPAASGSPITADEAILESESILPMTIHGHKVSGVLVARIQKHPLHEYHVSISVDRTSRDFRRAGYR